MATARASAGASRAASAPAFFAWLEANADALAARDAPALAHAVATCCARKAAIVARDETEQGERMRLNFGHTFGHAIEAAQGYGGLLHGEAVAVGMVLAARLSTALGRAPGADAERLAALLRRFDLPVALPPGLAPDALIARMRLDKKARSGAVRVVLWSGIGRTDVVDDVPDAALRDVLAH